MINIVCVKWGDWCAPYTADYVNNLARGVRDNLSLPYKFICFTDDPTGLDPDIEVRLLPENLQGWWWKSFYANRKIRGLRKLTGLPYLLTSRKDKRRGIDDGDRKASPYPVDLLGWYNKMYLFKPGVLSGTSFFIDLDTVITGSLDELAAYDGDFCIMRDVYRALRYQSSIMIFKPEATGHLWTEFVRKGCPIAQNGDQQFIQKHMPKADFFQDILPGQIVSYKLNCRERGVPWYARMVCFHGLPRPHEVKDKPIYQKWNLTGKSASNSTEATIPQPKPIAKGVLV